MRHREPFHTQVRTRSARVCIGKGRGREEEGKRGEFPRYRSSSIVDALTREAATRG